MDRPEHRHHIAFDPLAGRDVRIREHPHEAGFVGVDHDAGDPDVGAAVVPGTGIGVEVELPVPDHHLAVGPARAGRQDPLPAVLDLDPAVADRDALDLARAVGGFPVPVEPRLGEQREDQPDAGQEPDGGVGAGSGHRHHAGRPQQEDGV